MTTSSWGRYQRTGMKVSYSAIALAGVGEHGAAEADHDVAVAGQQVDALERVVRVADDRVGLLDPVERCPLDDDPTAQVGVVRCEPRGREGALTDDQVEALARGVVPLEVHRAEHRGKPLGHLGRRARHEQAARCRRAARRTSARPGAAPTPARRRWCRAPARRRARPAPAGSPARSAARRADRTGGLPGASPSTDAAPRCARASTAGAGDGACSAAVRPCRHERAPRRTRLVRGRARPVAAALLRRRRLDLAHHAATLADRRRLDHRAGHPGRHPGPGRQPRAPGRSPASRARRRRRARASGRAAARRRPTTTRTGRAGSAPATTCCPTAPCSRSGGDGWSAASSTSS